MIKVFYISDNPVITMVHPKTLTPFVLIIGGLSYIVLKYILRRIQSDNQVGNNPTFRQFQRRYFIVLIPAIFADWLQGPYLYALYRGYGYMVSRSGRCTLLCFAKLLFKLHRITCGYIDSFHS